MKTSKAFTETIIEQLGGSKFKAMTSASFSIDETERCAPVLIVSFKGSKIANVLYISLNADDLYKMKFEKHRGFTVKEIKEVSDVGAASLQEIFTSVTGLDTHL